MRSTRCRWPVTGRVRASTVVLADTLPAGLNWTVGGPDAGACSPTSPVAGGTALSCTFGTVAAGATKTITLTAATTTANCGTLKNSASVTTAGDTNSANNSSGPGHPPWSPARCRPPQTTVSLACPKVSLVNASFVVSGSVSPGTNASVSIQYTSPSGVNTTRATTSTGGTYSDTFTPSEMGPWSIQASSGGVSSDACPVIVYGKSEGGTFVIGDLNAVVDNTVEFWGAEWWKTNTWTGGVNPGVQSLKGYLDAVALPAKLRRLLVHTARQQLQAAGDHPGVPGGDRLEHDREEWTDHRR